MILDHTSSYSDLCVPLNWNKLNLFEQAPHSTRSSFVDEYQFLLCRCNKTHDRNNSEKERLILFMVSEASVPHGRKAQWGGSVQIMTGR